MVGDTSLWRFLMMLVSVRKAVSSPINGQEPQAADVFCESQLILSILTTEL